MFLITTADQRFWKIDQPVLFLGEWCRLYAQKALWQKMEHEVLAYHWDDRKKLFTDYQYLQDLYERTLALLADRLNVIHGEDHPIRYWRIIIGPWLLFFIQVFYDRFCSIEQAGRSGKVTGTLIGQYGRGDWVAKDFNDFFFWIIGDAYNYFLYSWIIERLKVLPYEYCDTRDRLIPSEGEGKKKSWGKFLVKDLILAYEKFFPHRLNKYVFISSYLSSMDQWRLQLSLGQWPSLFAPVVEVPTGEVKLEMRDGLSLPSSDKLFEDLLFQIIPAQVPSAYLEQYSSLKERSSAGYPSTPRLILTGNDFYANEGFKFFSAEQAQRGAKIVGVQHGGLYGQALWHAGEELETSVSDVFFTWGWDSPDMPRAKPLAAAKLNRFRKGISPDPKGKVVLALCSMPRYSYHLYSAFTASTGTLAYLSDQFSFVRGLNQSSRKELLVRLYWKDYDWAQEQRFKEQFPDLLFSTCDTPAHQVIRSSRLFVATYNATTYLETFTADFPTIIFWDPSQWKMFPSAQGYFDRLRSAGILFDTPEAAARKVNEIFDDPMAWWRSRDVQQAKNEFCARFARTSDNWLEEWRKELRMCAQGVKVGK